MLDKKEIERLVYERYPKTEKEFCCWQERMRLNGLRQILRNRLEQEFNKNGLQNENGVLRKEIHQSDGKGDS